MSKILAFSGRELRGLFTQRWLLVLAALLAMELLLGMVVVTEQGYVFDLTNVNFVLAFLGALAMLGLSLDAVAKERNSSALDLILTRPVERSTVILGKLLAYLALAAVISVVCILLPIGLVAVLGGKMNLDRFPLPMVFAAGALHLALFATLGLAISVFCRGLQSAFAIGGALWVTCSPIVWQFLVLRFLGQHIDQTSLAVVNVFNPMSAYYSAIQPFDSFAFGAEKGLMGFAAPWWFAYGVEVFYLLLAAAFALLLFNRQEEAGAA